MKRLSYIIITTLLVVMGISGCAGTREAYRATAGDLDATAKVITAHYTAISEELNSMAAIGSLSGASLTTVQDVVRRTRPTVLNLGKVARAYASVRSAENEFELNQAIGEAAKAISDLIDSLRRSGVDITRLQPIDKALERILEGLPAVPVPG